jgi:hypothetical protein
MYGIPEIKFRKSFCAINESGSDFKMGIYQETSDGKRRFISMQKADDAIALTITPIAEFRDYAFEGSYALPSDLYPGMFQGGERVLYDLYNTKKLEEVLDNKASPWRSKNCERNYEAVAVVDRFFHLLRGATVLDGDKKWKLNERFEAVSDKNRISRLRLVLRNGKMSILGFNKQSLTLEIRGDTQKVYQVDAVSLWSRPPPPQPKLELFYHFREVIYAAWKAGTITYNLVVDLKFVDKGFAYFSNEYGFQRFYVMKDNHRTRSLSLTGTPQIGPTYNYRYWLGYLGYFSDRFHADLIGYRFYHGKFFQFESTTLIFREDSSDWNTCCSSFNEYNFDRMISLWDSYVGGICVRGKNEECFVAPDFQLLGFEGHKISSSVIEKNGVIQIEGCDYVKL